MRTLACGTWLAKAIVSRVGVVTPVTELHGGGSRFVMPRELVVSGPVTEPGDVANQRERLAIEGQPPLQLIIDTPPASGGEQAPPK